MTIFEPIEGPARGVVGPIVPDSVVASGADLCRVHYNLAAAYNNLAYLAQPPELPSTVGNDTHISLAEAHCRQLLGYQPGGPVALVGPQPHDDFWTSLRLPTVILLAGILAVRDTMDPQGTVPSAHSLDAAALSCSEPSLHALVDEGSHVDLINWIGARAYSLPPRASYNLACYWALVGEDNMALHSLTMAATDESIARWAPEDLALLALQARRGNDFRAIVGLSELADDEQAEEDRKQRERCRVELAPSLNKRSNSVLAPPYAPAELTPNGITGSLYPDRDDDAITRYCGWSWAGTEPIESSRAPARVDLAWTHDAPSTISVVIRSRHRIAAEVVTIRFAGSPFPGTSFPLAAVGPGSSNVAVGPGGYLSTFQTELPELPPNLRPTVVASINGRTVTLTAAT